MTFTKIAASFIVALALVSGFSGSLRAAKNEKPFDMLSDDEIVAKYGITPETGKAPEMQERHIGPPPGLRLDKGRPRDKAQQVRAKAQQVRAKAQEWRPPTWERYENFPATNLTAEQRNTLLKDALKDAFAIGIGGTLDTTTPTVEVVKWRHLKNPGQTKETLAISFSKTGEPGVGWMYMPTPNSGRVETYIFPRP